MRGKHLAWRGQDLGKLADIAHRLKGEASNLGAAQITFISAQVEIAATQNMVNQIGDLLEELRDAADRFHATAVVFSEPGTSADECRLP